MPLYYNTETFSNINKDLTSKLDSGELSLDNAANYLKDTYNIDKEEWNKAAQDAIEAEENYFKIKKEHEDSILSFIPLSSRFMPAHLKEQEESTFQSILNFPSRAVQAGVRSTAEGLAQLGEMALGEKTSKEISDAAESVDKTLSENSITAPVVNALKSTFDPYTTTADEVTGQLGALATGTTLATKGVQAITNIPSIAARTLGFVTADLLVTDKDENVAKFLVENFPESASFLEALAIDPNDSNAEKVLKKIIESAGLGLAAEGVVALIGQGVKGLKRIRAKKEAVDDGILKPIEDTSGKVKEVEVLGNADEGYKVKATTQQPVGLIYGPEVGKEKGFFSRWFSSRQGLDERSVAALEARDNFIRAGKTEITQRAKELNRAIKKDFGVPYKKLDKQNIEDINIALSPSKPFTESSYDPKALNIYKKSAAKRTKAEKEYLVKVNEDIKATLEPKQQEALSRLPENVKNEVLTMRNLVDNYSKRIKDSGFTTKNVGAKLDENIGFYLTQDYELYSNPKWLKTVKKTLSGKADDTDALFAINQARSFFKKQEPTLADAQIDGRISEWVSKIEKGDEDFLSIFELGKTPKTNEHPLGKILSERKPIPDEVMAILRPVEDPLKRFSSTVDKQAKLLAEANFANDLRAILESPYGKELARIGFPEGTKFSTKLDTITNNYLRLAGPNKNPLADVYVTKSFKDKLDKGLDIAAPEGSILKSLYGLNGILSAAKTVLSHGTHATNLTGNVFLTAANGNLIPRLSKAALSNKKQAITELLNSSPGLKRLINADKDKIEVSIQELVKLQKLGLIDSGVTAEYVLRSFENSFEGALASTIKKPFEVAGKLYRGEDALFKVYNYYSELQKYSKAFKNASKEELEAYAAAVTKDTLPTYSRVPRILKEAKKVPIVGAFPSFLTEMIRTSGNIVRIGAKDFTTGLKTGNAELMKIGAERLASITALAVVGDQLLNANALEKGITKQDKDVVNLLSPTYNKNSDRYFKSPIYVNPKTGKIETTYINISRTNPYDPIIRMGKGLRDYAFSGKQFSDEEISKLVSSVAKSFEPVLTESLAAQMMLQLFTGKERGKPLYADDATIAEKTKAIATALGVDAIPQSLVDIYDTVKRSENEGLTGKPGVSKLGFPKRLEDKLYRHIGITQETMDLEKSIQYSAAKGLSNIKGSNNQIYSMIRDKQEGYDWKNPEKVEKFFDELHDKLNKSFDQQARLAEVLYKVKKLEYFNAKGERQKLDNRKLVEILSDKGINKLNKDYSFTLIEPSMRNTVGVFSPPMISQNLFTKMVRDYNYPPEIAKRIQAEIVNYAKNAPKLLEIETKNKGE